MLSYQHIYHAGNLADVHKHALLAWMLDYLTRKPKPLSYIETHAGRALYDLGSPESEKTGEAAQGVARTGDWFDAQHPYARALRIVRERHGPGSYPGSPLIAATLLRDEDRQVLAELHPAEYTALRQALPTAKVRREDGFAMAHALIPPTPRRGLLLCDPSYEVKSDYSVIPEHFRKWHRAWNVGILVLWYPILTGGTHGPMLQALSQNLPSAFRHEVQFPPARPGHGMVGSGLFVVNPPFGLAEEAAALKTRFQQLTSDDV